MAYKIAYKSSVNRDLKQLDKKTSERILREITGTLTNNPRTGEPLRGEFVGLYKIRIGNYRVIYAIIQETVLVLRIGHRSKVYE